MGARLAAEARIHSIRRLEIMQSVVCGSGRNSDLMPGTEINGRPDENAINCAGFTIGDIIGSK